MTMSAPDIKTKKERGADAIDWMQDNWPYLFPKSGQRRIALKIGIHRDILERQPDHLSKKDIRHGLRMWCRAKIYHEAIERGQRYDLDGNLQ